MRSLKCHLFAYLLVILTCGCSMDANDGDGTQEKVDPFSPSSNSAINGPAKGIYWMVNLPGNNQYKSTVEEVLSNNNCLNGIFIRINWNKIEKNQGEYDWDQLDWAIDLANKNDLQYKVMLLPGMHTPEWVYQKGAEAFETKIPWALRSDYGQPAKIPLPWDSVYQDYFKRIMNKFAERHDDDENFVAVTLTGANFVYGEMHLPKSDADIAKWKTYGNYRQRIEDVYNNLSDFYADTFQRQQFSLHITIPIKGMQNNVKNIIDYAEENYPDRITVQNAQLTGHQSNQDMFSYKMIMQSRASTYVGFQSLNSFVNMRERTGSPKVATYNFVKAGGQYWELLKPDGKSTEFTCQLAGYIEKARGMGAENYRRELENEGIFQDDFDQKRERMEQYIKEGKYDEALEIINETFRFIKVDINKKVEILQKARRTDDAIDFLKSVIERESTPAFYEMLAEVYESAGQYHEAANDFEQAFLRSKNSDYLIRILKLYANNNFKTEAAETGKRYIKIENYSKEAYQRVRKLYEEYEYEAALEKLEAFDPPESVSLLPKQGWVTSDYSDQAVETGKLAENIIDGDFGTWWHSDFEGGNDPHPHTLTVDMGEQKTIEGFQFVQAPYSKWRSRIKRMELKVSDDGSSWTSLGQFDLLFLQKPQQILLDEKQDFRYFKIFTLESWKSSSWNASSLGEVGAF